MRSGLCVLWLLCLGAAAAAARPGLELVAGADEATASRQAASPRPSDPDLIAAQRRVDDAQALEKAGKYDEALAIVERALAIRERLLGPDDLAVADALHLVAVLLDHKSEHAQAEPINRRALAIREKHLGGDHPDVARSLFNLAWLAAARQDFAAA
jgi:tetratricopeptide (TPR) repeat protein